MNRSVAIASWSERLRNRMPEGAAPIIATWIVDLKVIFVISAPRKSKLGDFMPPHEGRPARISVNNDLNPYNFLITTIHEFAHLGCYLKYGSKAAPHGPEWKSIYTDLLRPFMNPSFLPEDIHRALKYHVSKPSASSCSCPALSRALALYDKNPGVLLCDLKINDNFIFRNLSYRVLEKRRTRYLCQNTQDGKRYLITGRAKVEPLVHNKA